MDVLIVGSGGREHALALALHADPMVERLYAAPGNPGIGEVADCRPSDPGDPETLASLAVDLAADLVVVGPEAPLVAGAADAVRARGIACFGPSGDAARIEGSKAFAKDVMTAAGVPTARAQVVDNPADEAALAAALEAFGPPYVIKDDGLASGKGVVVTEHWAEALAHARGCARVVVEEFLDGPEMSLFAVTDGTHVVPLPPAQDFKRLGDNDTGPNTGGMGAYAPLPWAPQGLVAEVVEQVVQPTVDALRQRGTPFVGLLYAGLALTSRGVRVVEFNARFGDPETQSVLPLLQSSLAELLYAAATGTLNTVATPRWSDGAAVTVVVAAPGYPGAPRTGAPIAGLAEVAALDGIHLTHAGTFAEATGSQVRTAGGRVLGVTAVGGDLTIARDRVYDAVARLGFEGAQHRHDIALKAVHGEVDVPARP